MGRRELVLWALGLCVVVGCGRAIGSGEELADDGVHLAGDADEDADMASSSPPRSPMPTAQAAMDPTSTVDAERDGGPGQVALDAGGAGDRADGDGGAPEPDLGLDVDGSLEIRFDGMYSAHDGVHDFRLPAIVVDTPDARWSTSHPDAVRLEPDSRTGGVMITMLRPGTVTIVARRGGQGAAVPLEISAATPAEWALGQQLYSAAIAYAGAVPNSQPPITSPSTPSCQGCHGNSAMALDVQHSPQQTGGYSDTLLAGIITRSERPPGSTYHTPFPPSIFDYYHKWDATPEQARALVVYLRSLEPRTQGPLDFQQSL